MALPLPPNVSAGDFRTALSEFTTAVGAQWVFTTEEDVLLYRDSYSIFWGEPEERIASAAVAPANVEQVQQIVRIANKYKIPLYSISTGRNLTYGGSSPTLRGSVIVDLKRMNKILAVDEKRHFALVEPGVSYFDLYNYIKEHKLKVMLDIPDPGWGSPIGNSLDHGVGYTMAPFRDHFGSHCGMEIVTAEGDLLRTGSGAIPDSDAWQDYHYGVGPTVDGLFAQSNFGIVTKMGFWLMPLPETYLNGTVTVPRYQDLQAMIDEVSYLEDSFLIGMPQFGSPAGGGLFSPSPPELVQLMQGGWPTVEQTWASCPRRPPLILPNHGHCFPSRCYWCREETGYRTPPVWCRWLSWQPSRWPYQPPPTGGACFSNTLYSIWSSKKSSSTRVVGVRNVSITVSSRCCSME